MRILDAEYWGTRTFSTQGDVRAIGASRELFDPGLFALQCESWLN